MPIATRIPSSNDLDDMMGPTGHLLVATMMGSTGHLPVATHSLGEQIRTSS
jgi:hypothetical protein